MSFLSSVSLWMGALLAVPLIIHFLGRQRLRRVPFPSLLLVKERFSRSMRRHRLKNLLLLILRTLLILCLLAALANPVYRGRGAWSRPEATAALLHNGVYGKLKDGEGVNSLERQRRMARALDSASGKRAAVTLMLPSLPAGGGTEAAARFGDYREALGRWASSLGAGASSMEGYIPVFAWADLLPARDIVLRALREHPGLRVVFTDFGGLAENLGAFSDLRAQPSPRAPLLRLSARLYAPKRGKAQLFLNDRLFQEAAPEGNRVEFSVPLGEGAFRAGKALWTPESDFAVPEYHFCFPNPGSMILVHAGTTLISLPTLGRENYYRKIIHAGSARDIPWNAAEAGPPRGAPDSGSEAAFGRTARPARGAALRLVYLSDESGGDPAAYGRVVEFVKQGGLLILGAGQKCDAALWNRFLLQPLRLGRLGSPGEAAPGETPAVDRAALANLFSLPADVGPGGSARKRFAFTPENGTVILVSQRGAPLLAERDFHKGRVLLWTTDLDDLDWTDMGVQPMVPLIHQAFQESGGGGEAQNRSAASDSVYSAAWNPEEPSGAPAPEVLDPLGRPFDRVKAGAGRLRIGPFDKLGLYRIVTGGDTQSFAVNLASLPPRDDWEEWNGANKDAFLKGFEGERGRVTVSPPEAAGAGSAAQPLWRPLLLAALLLLLLEGVLSAFFALRRSPSQGRL